MTKHYSEIYLEQRRRYVLCSKKQPNVYYSRDNEIPSTTMIRAKAYVFNDRSEAIMFKTPDWGIKPA